MRIFSGQHIWENHVIAWSVRHASHWTRNKTSPAQKVKTANKIGLISWNILGI
jgi:hypothetical protein